MQVEHVVAQHFPGRRIVSSTPLSGGVSGTIVAKVEMAPASAGGNVETVVVKTGPRVGPEIDGYNLLRGTPLTARLPRVLASGGSGYLVLSWIETVGTLMEVVLGGRLPDDEIIRIFRDMLRFKTDMWIEQARSTEPQTKHPYPRSLIRTEFREAATAIANFYGEDAARPIIVDEQELPSLSDGIKVISEFLYGGNGGATLALSHGDLKPSNVLVTRDRDWRAVDCEWSGWCDWVESLSRIGKWQGSQTMRAVGEQPAHVHSNGSLSLRYAVEFSPICRELQELAIASGEGTAAALGDQGWRRRLNLYLAASLLNEIVLLERRGLAPAIGTILLGEAMKLVRETL